MLESNESLDNALREAESYIDNEDFSRRVMEGLPPRKRRSRISRRKGIVLSSGVLGCLMSVPFLASSIGQPEMLQLLSTQWAATIISMVLLAGVALTSWWLFVVRE